MSDTPLTDAKVFDWTAIARGEAPDNSAYVVDADFARQLERDNARLRDALQTMIDYSEHHGDYETCVFCAAVNKARQALKGE